MDHDDVKEPKQPQKPTRPSHEAMRANLADEARAWANKGYIAAVEAAARSGKGRATIYRWCHAKKLTHKRTGGDGTWERYWILASDLKAKMSGAALRRR